MKKEMVRKVYFSAIQKVFVGIHKGYFHITCGLARVLGYADLNEEYLKSSCQMYEKSSDYYAAYKIREKKASMVPSIESLNVTDESVGILIQGPLVLKDHFTLETIRLYAKLFPSCKVILSTWDNESTEELSLIKKELNCIVVTSPIPADPGIINVNLQCISTRRGIEEIEKLGLQYVAKTRTDWRMYQKGSLRFMVHMLQKFPCDNQLFKQNKRIITMDIATSETSILFYPFWLSDIFQFGDIEDMKNYWNHGFSCQGEMTKSGLNQHIRSNKYTWGKRVSEGLLIEARLSTDYYKRMTGNSPNITVDEYWEFVKRYFMIIPRSLTGGYWFKYDSRRYNESADWGTCFKNDSEEKLLTYNFDFVSWMNLICGDFDYPDDYKNMCNTRFYS